MLTPQYRYLITSIIFIIVMMMIVMMKPMMTMIIIIIMKDITCGGVCSTFTKRCFAVGLHQAMK